MNQETRLSGATRVLSGILQSRTGQVLADNRMWRLETLLKPILRAHGFSSMEHLVDRILSHNDEALTAEVVNALLNNESSFFRDQQVFRLLMEEVLPHIAATKQDRLIRIWSAGCSTGQEAYSLAMAFRKQPEIWEGWRIQILGTDISTSAIARARSGLFPQMDVQRGLAITDLLKWFEQEEDDWRISPDLRAITDFRVDNLFECNIPSGRYDIVLCRNVLLYFSPELRQQVFDKLASYCAPGSYLVLGAGETVIGQTEHFSTSQQFRGIYERTESKADSGTPYRRSN
jgi:chemotaxis protein methyltransferase CheR